MTDMVLRCILFLITVSTLLSTSEAVISFPIAKLEENFYQTYKTILQIGTPPQNISVEIDTGSSDLVFSSADNKHLRRYNSSHSSSFQAYPELGTFSGTYGDAEANGTYFNETVTFPGATVLNMTAALVDAEHTKGVPFTALLGLSYDDLEDRTNDAEEKYRANHTVPSTVPTYPNFISQLKIQGIIKKKAYSLWLDDQTIGNGELVFGALDKAKFEGPLIYTPITKDEDTGFYDYLSVAWTFLELSGLNGTRTSQGNINFTVTLDSGSTMTELPLEVANWIAKAIGAKAQIAFDYTSATGMPSYDYFLPCNVSHSVRNSRLMFGFGDPVGPKIGVTVKDLILKGALASDDASEEGYPTFGEAMVCQLGFTGMVFPQYGYGYTFGDTFLRSAYVVYDLEDKKIGMAQSKHGVTKSDLEEIQ